MGGLKVACKDISVGFLQVCRLEHRLLYFLDMKAIFTSIVQIQLQIRKAMSRTAFKIYSLIPGSKLIQGRLDLAQGDFADPL